MPDLIDVPIRPVTKGIVRDVADNSIPLGGFRDLQNIFTTRFGLKKRGGLSVYYSLSAVGYPPIRGMETFWDTTGVKTTVVLDTKFLYKVTSSGYLRQEWTYTTGTLSTSGTTATGSGTLWNTAASYVQAGDLMVLDADASGDGPEEILISSITNDTTLTLASTPVGTYGAGTDYKIVRAFKALNKDFVDWSVKADTLYIADYSRPLVSWDGSTFSVVYSGTLKAKAVLYYKDRLFVGNLFDTSGSTYHKQRLAWGEVASETLDNSLDLIYTSDELLRIVPLSDLLVLYFENSIWIGRPTNQGTSLPYEFDQLNTGGIGLIGARAVAPWTDGHFFIGQDNFYFLSISNGLQTIGDRVFDIVERNTSYLWGSYVAVDPQNNMVVFGIPGTGGSNSLARQYMFNYITKAWCSSVKTVDFLASENLINLTTIDGLVGTINNLTGTIDELSGGQDLYRLWSALSGALTTFEDNVVTDNGDNISVLIETGDIDFDKPNVNKGYFRCSLKLRNVYSSAVSGVDFMLNFYGSVDKGQNWKLLGTFNLTDGQDEDKIFFSLLGGQARFRLSNPSVNFDQFEIEELVLSIKGKGIEIPGQQQG